MKKSKLALVYGLLCFLLPVILIIVTQVLGVPRTPNVDGVDYGAGALMVALLVGSTLVALVSGILIVLGRNKNKSDLILYALVFTGMLTVIYLAYPLYSILPISVSIIGTFAYKEVKELEKHKTNPIEPQSIDG
jgi:uncharacterized membrane protein YozB (DUF420 family)